MADKYFFGNRNTSYADDTQDGVANSNWFSDIETTPTSKPADGDRAWIYGECTLDEDTAALAGLDVYQDGDLTLDPDADITVTIEDGYDIQIASPRTLTAHPNSSYVHTFDLVADSEGNCEFVVASGSTLDLQGDKAWRTGDTANTNDNWYSAWSTIELDSGNNDMSASDTSVVLEHDLDLNANNVANMEVLIEQTDGDYTHIDVVGVSSYNSETKTITLDAGGVTYAHDEGAYVYVLDRNVVVKSSGSAGWTLTGSGDITATEVYFEASYRHDIDGTADVTRCVFYAPTSYVFYDGNASVYLKDVLFTGTTTSDLNYMLRKWSGFANFVDVHAHRFDDTVYNCDKDTLYFRGGRYNGYAEHGFIDGSFGCVLRGVSVRSSGGIGLADGYFLVVGGTFEFASGTLLKEARAVFDSVVLGTVTTIDSEYHAIFKNFDNGEGDHRLYDQGSLIQRTEDESRSGRTDSLDISPVSDTGNARPLWVKLASRKVEGNSGISCDVYAMANAAYGTTDDPTFYLALGGAGGTEASTNVSITDTAWTGGDAQLSVTPSGSAGEYFTVDLWVKVTGDAGNLYVDFEFDGNDDAELEYWPMNVIGEAAAGGGGGIAGKGIMTGGRM